MTQLPSTLGATIAINVKCLAACGFGWAAWAIWPETPQWWGLGFTSILLSLGAATLVLDAIKLMVRVYTREKALRAYLALGHAPKSAEMASPDQLDKAGMR